MKAKIWIGAVLFAVLVIVALLILVPGRDKEEVQFSTGCTDIADLWTDLPQEKKIQECNKLISSHTADLENIGFEPADCRVIRAEAMDCEPALGTRLVCTYLCSKNAE
jgi:hypothetical protein